MAKHELYKKVTKAYTTRFQQPPQLVVRAPGRVNLIGEHTDYNDGFVLPVAVDQAAWMAVGPSEGSLTTVRALDIKNDEAIFSTIEVPSSAGGWADYPKGVLWAFLDRGLHPSPINAVLASDVPVGAGMSSSAAIELAFAFAWDTLGEFGISLSDLALLCQKAENEFVGMRCGIMDQYIISLGRRDHALLIDCRSLEYKLVPVPAGVSLVICDTQKRRGLVDSEYNTRRNECEAGARALGVPALRDVSVETFEARQEELGPVTRKRCRHVVTENQRVLDAVDALGAGDLERFGALMNASHVSLRDDYEVSCAELDAMVEAAWRQPGVLGARMTGAGFGGCTVNLVRDEAAETFQHSVAREYTDATGLEPRIYVCAAEDGVRLLRRA